MGLLYPSQTGTPVLAERPLTTQVYFGTRAWSYDLSGTSSRLDAHPIEAKKIFYKV